jgi:hypothetical protein
MKRRILTTATAVGAILVLGVPTAWGSGEPVRDHGDATQAKLAVQPSSIEIVRDHGDATQAKLMLERSLETQPVVTSAPDWFERAAAAAERNSALVPFVEVDAFERADRGMVATPPPSTESGTNLESGTDIAWLEIVVGLGMGLALGFGLYVLLRYSRRRQLAH